MSTDPVIWEGIFTAFPAEKPDEIFESDRWLARTSEAIEENQKNIAQGNWKSSLVHEYPLAPAVAALLGSLASEVSILDFGGGMATSYFPLRASLPSARLRYDIVESAAVCARGQKLFADSEVSFMEQIPDKASYHVVHAGASLHYVEHWKALLEKFATVASHQIILSGLTAGDQIPTFVTWQLYYGSRVPVWFWNLSDVVSHMETIGWRLAYRSLLASEYRGTVQPLPMSNFPPSHRLERKCNLIFLRKENA
ncbi:MAG: methyltransferase, TIGR04325 family [Leptospirales bacterium]|nr:methyltransferase, TIGR04325 family [Leptospirales bacterium]